MGMDSLIENAISYTKQNPVGVALGAAGAAAGIGLGTAAIVGAVKRRKTKRRKARTVRARNRRVRKTGRRRKRYYPHTAGKRKDSSRRRIRFTKNGQPYIIKGNGRAQFISKRSARVSRARKGGKY